MKSVPYLRTTYFYLLFVDTPTILADLYILADSVQNKKARNCSKQYRFSFSNVPS